MRPVEKYSYGYEMARTWVKITFKRLFYRSWKIRGLEKIEPNKPYIFASNHQNALMDALQIALLMKAQPIFLARADIFKKKPIARILNWMKIMPVYRIRDGYDSLQKNDEIFEKCAHVLKKGSSLVIFPEGNHGSQRNLRMLKKGLARVAFGAEKATNFELGLEVVPVGIDYSHYEKFRARVTISIGNPIPVKQFQADFEEDAQKGYKALNEQIRTELEPLMIEIPWKNMYDGVMGMRTLYGARFAEKNSLPYETTFNRFDADKMLISAVRKAHESEPEKTEKTAKKTATYFKLLKRSKIRDHVPANAPYGVFKLLIDFLLLIIGFPFFLYGAINHAITFWVPDKLSRSIIKDTQFRSSVAYALGFVLLLPIMYILQILLVQLVFHNGWISLIYFISLVPMGLFAIHYSFFAKKTLARAVYSSRLRKKNEGVQKLLDLRNGLIAELDEITA